MRIGIIAILAAIIAGTAVAQGDDMSALWTKFDDMFLRNFWRTFFNFAYIPAIKMACALLPPILGE